MAAREVKVAAIVPALNEEQTIGGIVAILKQSPLISEVVVVSDGSTDNTAEIARAAGAHVVRELPHQQGKGEALKIGTTLTDASVVLFVDADLIDLTLDHIHGMLTPVIAGDVAMNVGIYDRGVVWNLLARLLPQVSGQRAMARSVIDGVPSQYVRGWYIEPALNYYCSVNKLQTNTVLLRNLNLRRKVDKVGFWRGMYGYIAMFYYIGGAVLEVRRAHDAFVSTEIHEKHISA